eukprot:5012634-Prymnesium_polylepis.1
MEGGEGTIRTLIVCPQLRGREECVHRLLIRACDREHRNSGSAPVQVLMPKSNPQSLVHARLRLSRGTRASLFTLAQMRAHDSYSHLWRGDAPSSAAAPTPSAARSLLMGLLTMSLQILAQGDEGCKFQRDTRPKELPSPRLSVRTLPGHGRWDATGGPPARHTTHPGLSNDTTAARRLPLHATSSGSGRPPRRRKTRYGVLSAVPAPAPAHTHASQPPGARDFVKIIAKSGG